MNISEPWIEPGTWSDDGYLGKHRVELLPGAVVSSLWQKLFDLLPDLILIQMPAVVIVNAGAGSRVRCTCEYTHIHTPTLNDRHSQACNETYADKIKKQTKKTHTKKWPKQNQYGQFQSNINIPPSTSKSVYSLCHSVPSCSQFALEQQNKQTETMGNGVYF